MVVPPSLSWTSGTPVVWATELRDTCTSAGVAFFFKQWGGRTPKAGGRELEGEVWDQLPDEAVA